MTLTVDWQNKIVDSSGSITDVVAIRAEIRALEESDEGILYPPIMTYKELSLSGGAVFPAIDFINGYQLRFPNPGNYTISGGNFNATIIPVSGVFIERSSSSSYAVTSVGGNGPTAQDIAVAVRNEITPELSHIMTLQNGLGLDSNQATMLLEIYRLYGLDPTIPLVVTDTSRVVGAISQSITSTQSSTTIKRV